MSIESKLKAPFKKIHWRISHKTKDGKKAMVLAYVNARDVMKRLDEVCGIDGWQCVYPFEGCCEISIKFGDEWVTKSNGAGHTQVEGEKGGYSDAFKRAASLWGVSRYLYYLGNSWVPIDDKDRFTPPPLPAWAQWKESDDA